MITHLDERVSLEQLAFRNQINLSLFHKIFLQIYGDTPYSYLKKYKMNIIGIVHGEEVQIMPSADYRFSPDEHIKVISDNDSVDAYLKHVK